VITWAGFIGKLLELMATKLLGKKVDLFLDDKKKAGSYFVRLYVAVSELEKALSVLLDGIEDLLDGKEEALPSYWLQDLSSKIDVASKQFLESVDDLSTILEIYDPVLSRTVSHLGHHKFSFLYAASEAFRIEEDEKHNVTLIKYERPNDELMRIDFEKAYEWDKANFNVHTFDEIEWPNNILMGYFGDEVVEGQFKPDDRVKIKEFYDVMKAHLSILSGAREELRKFIESNFSIEDVLHVRNLKL